MPNALPQSAVSTATPAGIGAVSYPVRGRIVVRPDLQIPILTFHGEDPTVDIQAGLRKGLTFITVAQLCDGLAGRSLLPSKPAVIVCDDGHLWQYRTIFPIAQSYGVPITIAVIPNLIDGLTVNTNVSTFLGANFTADTTSGSSTLQNLSNTTTLVQGTKITGAGIPTGTVLGTVGTTTATMVDASGNPVNATATATAVAITGPATPMTWPQLNEIIAAGGDAQNHTLSHDLVVNDSTAKRNNDYPAANARIAAMTGRTPKAILYPQASSANAWSAQALSDIKAMGLFELGIIGQLGSRVTPALPVSPQFAFPRITPGTQPFEEIYDQVIYSYHDDITGVGANAGNALGYWGAGSVPNQVNGGTTIRIGPGPVGTGWPVAPADWQRVRPGSIVNWRFDATVTGWSAGAVAVEIQEYTGPANARVGGTLNTLKTYNANQATTNQEGSFVLNAATQWVRFQIHVTSAFTGTLDISNASVRAP